MIGHELGVTLHQIFVGARRARHQFITVEHLLLALLDNPSAVEVLRACACPIEDLRSSLQDFVSAHTPVMSQSSEIDSLPTLGFHRVIQRAQMHVQPRSSRQTEVTGADVLVAIFGEKDSHAAYYLHQQGVTRLDLTTCISRGIASAQGEGGAESPGEQDRKGEEWLDRLIEQQRDSEIGPLIAQAVAQARQARQEFVTVEHLLLALLDSASVAQVLRACACNIEDLRRGLQGFVSDRSPVLPPGSQAHTQPTLGFMLVVQRAVMTLVARGASNGQEEVTGVQMLQAIFGESDSQAVYCLHQQGVMWPDVSKVIGPGGIGKFEQVSSHSRQHQHPLQCVMEEA